MQTQDAIRARRNVREFLERPIAESDLDLILEAARRTPSSQNTQPWDLIVITEREQLVDLARVWVGAAHVAHSAATIALIAPAAKSERHEKSIQYDLGQLTMSIMVAAADLGIGSGHSGVGEYQLAQRLLGYPHDRVCKYLIALGYPAHAPLRPTTRLDRRPIGQIVHRGRW
jgi:nitroreductase